MHIRFNFKTSSRSKIESNNAEWIARKRQTYRCTEIAREKEKGRRKGRVEGVMEKGPHIVFLFFNDI